MHVIKHHGAMFLMQALLMVEMNMTGRGIVPSLKKGLSIMI